MAVPIPFFAERLPAIGCGVQWGLRPALDTFFPPQTGANMTLLSFERVMSTKAFFFHYRFRRAWSIRRLFFYSLSSDLGIFPLAHSFVRLAFEVRCMHYMHNENVGQGLIRYYICLLVRSFFFSFSFPAFPSHPSVLVLGRFGAHCIAWHGVMCMHHIDCLVGVRVILAGGGYFLSIFD